MSSLARKPARGNWIWLGGALSAVAVLTGVAAGTAASSPAGGAARAAGGQAAPGGRVPADGQVAAGRTLASRPGTRGPASSAYLAGTPAVAVFYDLGTALGGCSLGPFPASGRYVSLPPERFGHSAACGGYITVQGPRGQVRAEVVDLCPGCAADMIDLSRAAFTVIANPRPGSARVRYWPLDNPPLPGPLLLRIGQTRAGLLTVQVRRHGNALAGVAVASPAVAGPGIPVPSVRAPAWQRFRLNGNGIWVAPGPLGTGPASIRITDTRGHQVVIRQVRLRPGRVIRTRTWMYAHRARRVR